MPLSASDVAAFIDQLPPALRAAIEGMEYENERLRERVEELARENGFDACRAEEEQENAARAKAETQRAEQEQARLTALCKTCEHELAELATKRDAAEGRMAILLERTRMLEADVATANDARAKVEATLRLRDHELATLLARFDSTCTDLAAANAVIDGTKASYELQLADVRSGAEHLRRAVIQLARSNQAFMGIDDPVHEARAGEVIALLEELWRRERDKGT